MTQKQVAAEIGKTVGCISQYETGLRKLPVPVAKQLGNLYMVPWELFYEDDDDGQDLDGEANRRAV